MRLTRQNNSFSLLAENKELTLQIVHQFIVRCTTASPGHRDRILLLNLINRVASFQERFLLSLLILLPVVLFCDDSKGCRKLAKTALYERKVGIRGAQDFSVPLTHVLEST
jgi:hypothetical protein